MMTESIPTPIFVLVGFVLAVSAASWIAYQLAVRRVRQTASEMTNLNELGRQLLRSQLSIDSLAEMVYWQVGQIVPSSSFQIGLFEDDVYRVIAWVRDSKRFPETYFADGAHKGIVGWVRETGQPLLVRDYQSEREHLPAFPEFELDDPPRSGLFVPLIAGTATIGVMAVQSRQVARFTDEHMRILGLLANQVAWAIRNAHLYEHAQRRAEQLNLIGQVTAQISAVQTLSDLLGQVVGLIKDKFGYYCVSVFIKDGDLMHIGASTNELFKAQAPPIEMNRGMIGWAAAHAKTALANDVLTDPRYRQLGILPETRGEISLPLKVEDRVLGVLDVQSDLRSAFDAEDVFVLETLAYQVAMAIEQAETYEAEHWLAQRLEALVQVSQAVVSVLDLDDLLDRLVDLICDAFGYKRVHIFLCIGDQVVFRVGVGPHTVRWLIDKLSYSINDEGLIPAAVRTGKAELIEDVSKSGEYRPGPGVEDTRVEMVVPMKMAGHVVGVIDIQSDQLGAFGEDDVVLMQSLADSVAVAIRNAALYLNERRRTNLAETLREISTAVASDLDLDRVLASILSGLSRVVTIDSVAILLVDEGAATMTVMATIGDDLEGILGHQLPLESLDATDEGELEDRVRQIYHDLLHLPEDHACLITQLHVGGDLIGFLIADRHDTEAYSPNDQEIISAFASQASVAINNARLFSGQQSEAWVTTALLQVAGAVNAQTNVSESLETIARLTALLAGVSRCVIFRWDPDLRSYELGSQYPLPTDPEAATSGPVVVLAEPYPYLDLLSVADRPIGAGAGHQLPIPPPMADIVKSRAIMSFPLRAKNQPVGLLIVDDPHEGRPFDTRMLNILTGIAHQTATALDTANLQSISVERDRLEQELRVAHQIQATFIPDTPPSEPGWDIAAVWRAARQVSGDFYDFIPLPSGLWGMVIADVADKGMPAALFMAMCRTLVRAAAISRTSPAETLARVNQLLFNDSNSDLFVTVLYAVWNPTTGQFVYANAGHNPPLLISGKQRRVTRLDQHGLALGVMPEISLKEYQVTLKPDDILIAYTDGITEAMTVTHEEWGIERFSRIVRKAQSGSAGELLERILDALDTFVADAAQSDDVTMWVLKRQPDSPEA